MTSKRSGDESESVVQEIHRESVFLSKDGAEHVSQEAKRRRSRLKKRHRNVMIREVSWMKRKDVYNLLTTMAPEIVAIIKPAEGSVYDLTTLERAVLSDRFTRPDDDDGGSMFWDAFSSETENMFRTIMENSIFSAVRGTRYKEVRLFA